MSEEEKKELILKLRNIKSKNLGFPFGYLFSLYCILVITITPWIICRYGLLVYSFFIPFRVAIDYIDKNTTNAHEINNLVIKLNGFNPERVTSTWFINSLVLLVYYPIFNYVIPEIEEFSIDFYMILKIVILALITEMYFTTVHNIAHTAHPNIHKLHHCCIVSTISSVLVFSPVDKYLEFYIPNLIALIISAIFNDYQLFLAYSCFHNIGYSATHDEYLKAPHWYHHKFCDSSYNIYLNFKSYNPDDAIKKCIIR